MSIWVLLMVLLAPGDGFQSVYFLNKFDTLAECTTEQQRIAAGMSTAYPGDQSYRIECREKRLPAVATSAPVEQTNYTQIIRRWAQVRHPQSDINFKVLNVKAIQTDNGPNGIMAFHVHLFYETGVEGYILFIRNGTVIGWIYTGVPDAEEEEEGEEVFSYKDQA